MPTSNNSTKKRQASLSPSKQDDLLNIQTSYYFKPEDMKLTDKQKLQRFIWDSQSGKFLGRNVLSWWKIGLFYLVFYGMLVALIAICAWVFSQTLDPRIPKWQLDGSLIGMNPGLGFRPMPLADNAESTLIWFEGSNKTSFHKWVTNLMDFLDEYYTPGKTEKGTASIVRCSYNDPPAEGQVCDFDVRLWEECSPDKFFNYHRNAPCIFLKLNRIYGWIPEFYEDPNDLPEQMPENLKSHIRNVNPRQRKTIWISCEGENPADVEYLGPITYYPPIQGFPGYYYPFNNSEGYLSPLVAVQFLRPRSKISLFYLGFYGMLAALVAICIWVFFQTLDPRVPKWQLDSSIIGTNPGLGFRPMPISDNAESTLIWFEGSNKTNFQNWVDNLMGFLDEYYTPSKTEKGTASIRRCSYSQLPEKGQVCDFDVRLWEECSPDKFFNYHRNAPCIFLKLNRIYGWTPEFYEDPNDLPEKMPENLKQHIISVSPEQRKTIWISCEGENSADMENLGPITYYPKVQGFPGYYYPYENSEGYLSPLVAVQFLRPKSGIVINIECKAWAKNIRHSRVDRIGSVHFELLID